MIRVFVQWHDDDLTFRDALPMIGRNQTGNSLIRYRQIQRASSAANPLRYENLIWKDIAAGDVIPMSTPTCLLCWGHVGFRHAYLAGRIWVDRVVVFLCLHRRGTHAPAWTIHRDLTRVWTRRRLFFLNSLTTRKPHLIRFSCDTRQYTVSIRHLATGSSAHRVTSTCHLCSPDHIACACSQPN